ncbi:fungal-specific transcription factor domain-containing protein [Radiomyces spectabilis]|uniref:fungal-specific transcription factor domain-containing protein n=1 Tax=Radiomyces spectabilis TaxID=64574 RepID=UPI00221ED0E5|nr:fungal-specific transcription factor domain-containing protein [Radiomyces spectabilis]KAI8371364.1 fungal-specific transcription factor domain-containing protein [Radiomyces spectabilis]
MSFFFGRAAFFFSLEENIDPIPTLAGMNHLVDTISVNSIGQGLYIQDWMARTDRIPSIYEEGAPPMTDLDREVQEPDLHMNNTPLDMDLIHLYFEHVHPYFPIVHRTTFQQQLQRPKPCILLLNAMYAVASRWKSTPPSSTDTPGWRYYQTALGLIDIYTDAPRLTTVQALLLLVKYHEHVRRPGFFWRTHFYFQIIVRMCKDLGLPREVPRTVQASAVELELRKRTFWAVYIYDNMMSTEQGSQASFDVDTCTVDYPNRLPDEEQDLMIHFHWLSKVTRLHGAVLQFMREKYGGQEEERMDQAMNEEKEFSSLQTHLESLTNHLTRTISVPEATETGPPASRFLYLAFHFVTILLHRPYAFNDAQDKYDPTTHRNHCVESATVITDIVQTLISDGVACLYYAFRGIQQIIHYLTAALTIHRLCNHSKYEQTVRLLKQLLDKTPATELDADYRHEDQSFTASWTGSRNISNSPSAKSSPVLEGREASPTPSAVNKLRRTQPNVMANANRNFHPNLPGSGTPDMSVWMQSSATITDPEAMQRLGYMMKPYAHHRLSAPLQNPSMMPPPQTMQLSLQQMGSYSQPVSPTVGYFPTSSFETEELLGRPHPLQQQQYSRLRSTPSYEALAQQASPRDTYMTTTPAHHRRHTVSTPFHQQQQHHLVTSQQITATSPSQDMNSIHQLHTMDLSGPQPTNFHMSSAYPYMIPPNENPIMLDPSAMMLTEPSSNAPGQSMMGLLMEQDTPWDFAPSSTG